MSHAGQYARAMTPRRYEDDRESHAAFVRRIDEGGTDTTPQLVYADFLDEKGHHGIASLLRDHAENYAGESHEERHSRRPVTAPHLDVFRHGDDTVPVYSDRHPDGTPFDIYDVIARVPTDHPNGRQFILGVHPGYAVRLLDSQPPEDATAHRMAAALRARHPEILPRGE